MVTITALTGTEGIMMDAGPRLLIIDDDEKMCGLLKDYLEPLGYVVDAVHNGIDGLDRAVNGAYAAIIMDVMMPGKNGIEVLTELRRHSLTPPVLMLT